MARSNPFDLRRASQFSNRRSREQLPRKSVMNESYDPEKEKQSGKEQLKAAAEDLKAAAAGKIEIDHRLSGTSLWLALGIVGGWLISRFSRRRQRALSVISEKADNRLKPIRADRVKVPE